MLPRRQVKRLALALGFSALLFLSFGNWDARPLIENAKNVIAYFKTDDLDEVWDETIDAGPLVFDLENGRQAFDWSDWLDLDKTKLFDRGSLDEKLYPYLSTLGRKERPDMPYLIATSPQEQAMIARLYCKWKLPAPSRVVALGDPTEGSLRTTSPREFKVEHANEELRHRQFGHDLPTEYHDASPPLTPMLKNASASDIDVMFPPVSAELFFWDAQAVANEADDSVQNHALTVKRALEVVESSGKYFEEVWIRDDPIGYGVHYDWRFFRGILAHEDHVAALHMLARTWQQFAEQMGITYWYAHGSLLGQYWNGMAMPWDPDHDIQMPVAELDRLARDFNRTLILQNRKEGFHKYIIDVGPYYVQRGRGNGKNRIDGRFIDVESGAYIDITGLAKSNPARTLIACKNRHLYHTRDFFRIRRTQFEGYPAYIPVDTIRMLQKEYRGWSNPKFDPWEFNPTARIWEFKNSCEQFINRMKDTVHIYCYPSEIMEPDECDAALNTCDRVTVHEFQLTGDVTNAHAREQEKFDLLGSLSPDTDFTHYTDVIESMRNITSEYFPPFRKQVNLEVSVAKSVTKPKKA